MDEITFKRATDKYAGYQCFDARVDQYDEGQDPATEFPARVVTHRVWRDPEGNDVTDPHQVSELNEWYAYKYGRE